MVKIQRQTISASNKSCRMLISIENKQSLPTRFVSKKILCNQSRRLQYFAKTLWQEKDRLRLCHVQRPYLRAIQH